MEFYNRTNNRSKNQRPSEIAQVSRNLAIALWQAVDSNDRTRLHFKIQRSGEDGQSFSTLVPKNALELPEVCLAACSVFSKAPGISSELREEFGRMSQLMEKVVSARKANGFDPEESNEPSRVLNL